MTRLDAMIIQACDDFHAGKTMRTPDEDAAILEQYPRKVILARMAKLAKKGILNYGVSLRTAWVERSRQCNAG